MTGLSVEERTRARETYARWLEWGVRIGFAVLAATFAAYVTGVLPATIPPAELPHLWGLSAREFVAATHAPTGWQWISRMGEGDTATLLGAAILAGATLVCQLRVLPILAATGERVLVLIGVLQVAVLLFAASGVFLPS